jgi:hypothetical protein
VEHMQCCAAEKLCGIWSDMSAHACGPTWLQAVLEYRLMSPGERWRNVYKVREQHSYGIAQQTQHHEQLCCRHGILVRVTVSIPLKAAIQPCDFRGVERERNGPVLQGLQVLEFLCKRGHDRCPVMAMPLIPLLKCLANFAYIGPDGKDYGANVRIR